MTSERTKAARACAGGSVLLLVVVAIPFILLATVPGDNAEVEMLSHDEVKKDPEVKTWVEETASAMKLTDFLAPFATNPTCKRRVAELIDSPLTQGSTVPQLHTQLQNRQISPSDVRTAMELSRGIYFETVPSFMTVVQPLRGAGITAPAHAVYAHDGTRTVYVVVRGSFELQDWITNALISPARFGDGLVHSGMAAAARDVFASTRGTVAQFLAQRSGWRIVCTGHSMGAAVAALLPVQFETIGLSNGIAIVFAPPPIIHQAPNQQPTRLLQSILQRVVLFVNDDDVVPTLTPGQITTVRGDVDGVCDDPAATILSRIRGLRRITQNPERVCLPGIIFHLFRRSGQVSFQQPDCNVAGGLGANGVRHHLVDNYLTLINQVFP